MNFGNGQYQAWQKICREKISPAAVIQMIAESGLCGRGGAGFPTGIKLGTDLNGGYVLVNAAECEPGLKHNVIQLEEDTDATIRGLKYCMEICNAAKGIIAIKKKNEKAVEILGLLPMADILSGLFSASADCNHAEGKLSVTCKKVKVLFVTFLCPCGNVIVNLLCGHFGNDIFSYVNKLIHVKEGSGGAHLFNGELELSRMAKALLLLAIMFLVTSSVSICGPIGFISLGVPNLSRIVCKSTDIRKHYLISSAMGVGLLIVTYLVVKYVSFGIYLPISATMAIIALPLMLVLFVRK